MLTLWGRASSVNVQKVLWALDELGLPYRRLNAGGRYGVVDTVEFAAMNPNRRVPVLQDGDLTLWESQAILRYLARREGRLCPADLAGQALADQWLAFSDTTLQPPFITAFVQLVRTPETRRNAAAIERARAEFAAALAILDGALARQAWLSGKAFGIADIAAGSLIHRIEALDLAPGRLDAWHRWAAALKARPAWQTHIATSFEELRAT